MPEKTEVDIPYSAFEYTANFTRPIISAWGKAGEFVGGFLEALQPWNFRVDETEVKMAAVRLGEHVITFQQPISGSPLRMRVSVWWSRFSVNVEQPDWSNADSILGLCSAVLEASSRVANAQIGSQQTLLLMHIQSKTTPRIQLTDRLLTPTARDLMEGDLKGQGIILNRGGSTLVIDNSLVYANALFVSMRRMFEERTALGDIAKLIRSDEERLWNLLDLEGAL